MDESLYKFMMENIDWFEGQYVTYSFDVKKSKTKENTIQIVSRTSDYRKEFKIQ